MAVMLSHWHAMPPEEVLTGLATNEAGLSAAEANTRLSRYGPNRLQEAPSMSMLKLVLDQLKSPLVLILIAAAALLFIVAGIDQEGGEHIDAILILIIVALNGALGFIQNYQANRGIEALKRLAAPMAAVLRDGHRMVTQAANLVPGDIVLLEEGDSVPADGRLLQAYDLMMDESALTGESLSVQKSLGALQEDTNLAERTCMVYVGTIAMSGRGRFVVTETGMETEVGEIAEAIQETPDVPSRFQSEMADLGKQITWIIAMLIALVAALQLTIGNLSPLETFVAAVALAVAAIPEGLPVVLTLAQAFGTRRMLDRNSLVRSLPVVEILGATQVICSDKTGTITEGRMSLRSLYWHGRFLEVTGGAAVTEGDFLDDGKATDQTKNMALISAGLGNNAHRTRDGEVSGDPTEVALLLGAYKASVLLDSYHRMDELPFSSQRKLMSVVVERDGRQFIFVKGAPEVVVSRSTEIETMEGAIPLGDAERDRLLEVNGSMADQALRVLALAYKEGPATSRDETEQGLVFLGLAGLSDPPRQEARAAIEATGLAGIRTVMITGDNRQTARAVAREVGLGGEALEGRDLDRLDDDELVDVVGRANIFARAEPEHKLRLLRALQSQDQVVVMTGDGVNDAPALQGADVGISMGIRGTDVARDASDMVLLDDNFATILTAIEEGRRIFANIKKFINYLFTGNVAEVLVVLVASLLGYLPVTAVQILWINLITDSGPALALGVDPAAPGLMRQSPRRGGVISRGMFGLVLGIGAFMAATILGTFFLGLKLFDLETAQTMTFTAFVVQEYLRLGVIRYQEKASFLANRWLVISVLVSLTLQIILLYSPLGGFFGVVPLGVVPWIILLGGLLIGFFTALRITNLITHYLGPV